MAEPDGALKAQLGAWFATLDPTVQRIFGEIYAEAPEAVSKALSGGEWVAAADDPPLSEVFGDQGAGYSLMVREVDVQPWPITPGAEAVIKWTLTSSPGQPGFRTDVSGTGPNGFVITETLDGAALAPGGELTQEIRIAGAAEGHYSLEIVINPDGAPLGEIPNANGTRIDMPYNFDVQGVEDAESTQRQVLLTTAAAPLQQLVGDQDPQVVRSVLLESLNVLAGYDGLTSDQSTLIGDLYERLDRRERVQEGDDAGIQALVDVGTAAAQLVANSTSLDRREGPDAEQSPGIVALDELLTALGVLRGRVN
ncbi:MAG: hypothetical protein M3527_03385 [Actinomycetota bacterium]|nr:hypothetical protein [Actinomycetota bacterium]